MRNIILCLLLLSAVGCDPVRRVLDSATYRTQVADALLRDGLCRYDTIVQVVRDTTIKTDTVGIIISYTDTITERDTVRITTFKVRDIVTRVTIRDTVTMSIVDAAGTEAAYREIDELKGTLKAVGAEAKRYRWAVALLLMLFVAVIIAALKK